MVLYRVISLTVLAAIKLISILSYKLLALSGRFDNSELRILLVTDTNQYGGAYTYLLKLIQSVTDKYPESVIGIAAPFPIVADLKLKFPKLEIFGYESNSNPGNNFRRLKHDLKLIWSSYRQIRPKKVILSVVNPGNFFTILTLPESIYILHTIPYQVLSDYQKWLITNSRARFVAISEFMAKQLRDQWQIPHKQIINISNPVSIEIAKSPRGVVKNTILSIGHLEEYKNPILWIKIARLVTKQHPQIEFVWLGDGPLLEVCLAEAASNPQIKFLGRASQAEIADAMEKSIIYLQPSQIESFGLAALDAMSFGIPCIVSAGHGLEEVVGNTGIVIDTFNAQTWANAINTLLANPEVLSELADKAENRAKSVYSMQNWQQQIYNMLNL